MPSRILSSSAVGTRGWDKMVERRGTGLPSYDGPGKVYSTSCKSITVSSFIFWHYTTQARGLTNSIKIISLQSPQASLYTSFDNLGTVCMIRRVGPVFTNFSDDMV